LQYGMAEDLMLQSNHSVQNTGAFLLPQDLGQTKTERHTDELF